MDIFSEDSQASGVGSFVDLESTTAKSWAGSVRIRTSNSFRSSCSSWVSLWTMTPVLFVAPSVVFRQFEVFLLSPCSENGSEKALVERCEAQRRALLAGALFSLARIASFQVEKILTESETRKCTLRSTHSGTHSAVLLPLPFLAREFAVSFSSYRVFVAFRVCLALAALAFFQPYFTDFVLLLRCVLRGVQNQFYRGRRDFLAAIGLLLLYMVILIIGFVDIGLGMLCSQRLLGFSVVFPHLNFPVLLFTAHHFLLQPHKRLCTVIYEEDVFIQATRWRCLDNSDCEGRCGASKLAMKPSQSLARERRDVDFARRTKRVACLDDVDPRVRQRLIRNSERREAPTRSPSRTPASPRPAPSIEVLNPPV